MSFASSVREASASWHHFAMEREDVWRLWQGQDPLGEIRVTDAEFPWLRGAWTATAAFGTVESLFAAELTLVNRGEVGEEWDAAYEQICALGIRLHDPGGRAVPEFLLHIDGDRAWFRWIDSSTSESV